MFSSLSHFLQCATDQWSGEELVRKFTLPNDETISCVLWNGMHFISGADIVKVVCFQYMEATNRPINSLKKFEEGIFSDLRSLKPGVHATLEEAKSPFLMYLYKEGCVRTQKKQKVFIWNSVNFEKLVNDAIHRSERVINYYTDYRSGRSHSIDLSSFPSANVNENLESFGKRRESIAYGEIFQSSSEFKLDQLIGPQAHTKPESQEAFQGPLDENLFFLKPGQITSTNAKFNAPKNIPHYVDEKSDRKFVCMQENCRKAFKRYEHLKRHFLTHTGERFFQCSMAGCGKMFARLDNLKQHYRTHEWNSMTKRTTNNEKDDKVQVFDARVSNILHLVEGNNYY